jgi:hypothetical protein
MPPTKDRTGCFPERGIEIDFQGLNEVLDTLRGKLGEVRYVKTREKWDRMRAAPK